MRDVLRRTLDPTLLLAAVLLAAVVIATWTSGHVRSDLLAFTGVYIDRAHQGDLYENWSIGGLSASRPDLYSDTARAEMGAAIVAQGARPGASAREAQASRYWQVTEPTSTPLTFAVLGYVRTGDWEVDSFLFTAASLAALVLGLVWLALHVGLGRGGALLAAAVVLATSEPLYSDLSWGNVNSLQVGMLAGYLALRSGRQTPARALAAGAVIGTAVLLKPNLALVVALLAIELLLARRWRDGALQLGGIALAGAAAFGITFVRFGSLEPWTGYLAYLSGYALPSAIPGFSVPATILQALGYDPIPAERIGQLVAILMVLLVAAAVAALARARIPGGPGFLAAPRVRHPVDETALEGRRWTVEATLVGLGVGIVLLASPFVENHHFLLMAPLAVVLLRPGHDLGGTRWVGLRQVTAALALFLFSATPAMVLAAQWDGVPYLACLAGATVVLVVAAIADIWADPLPAPQPRPAPVPVAATPA